MPHASKRDLIVATLHELASSAEDDDTQRQLASMLQKMQYMAPELMDHTWSRIFDLLRSKPAWPGAVQTWNAANQQFTLMK
jgi:nitrate reductase assembly molybdenum cofactor insertion protein NarJ